MLRLLHSPDCAVIKAEFDETNDMPRCTCDARKKRREKKLRERKMRGGAQSNLLDGCSSIGNGNYWRFPKEID